MEAFSAAVITGITTDLAKQVVNGLKSNLKSRIVGTPAEQAIEQCLGVGIVALIAQATAAEPEQETLLHDIFSEFFHYKAVRMQIEALLDGEPLDHTRLKTLFAAAGFDAATLPHLNLDVGLDAFAAAFVAAAVEKQELQGIIQIGQLQRSLGVQQELLAEMNKLAAVLREQTQISVQAGQVMAGTSAQPIYQWHIIGRDQITNAGQVYSGDFRGATLHIVNQYMSAPGEHLLSEDAFRDALATYLQVIAKRYERPELRGNIEDKDSVAKIKLDKMYYSLAALGRPESRETALAEQAGKSQRTPGQEPTPPVDMATLLRDHRRLAVTGKPGSGKSTYLYVIASTVARALLDGGSDLLERHVGLANPLPLPIFVSLGEFNDYKKGPPDPTNPRHGTLLAYASAKAIQKYELLGVPKDFFERLLVGDQMCLFLLDGLDEIADETERQLVSEEIRRLSDNPKVGPIVVTCRSWAYVRDTKLGDPFVEYEVQPMTPDQVDELVRLWCEAAYPPLEGSNASAKLAAEIRDLEEKRRQRGHRPLADTPLMVTIIAIVFYNDEHLPNQRAALYKRCVRVLLIEKQRPTSEAKAVRVARGGTEEDKLELLALLAYHMMTAEAGNEAGRVIEEKDVRAWLLPLISDRQSQGNPVEHLRVFLRAMVDDAGLLDERPRTPERGRSYEFVHLSFQEYLCASRLAGEPPQQVVSALVEADLVSQTWWRETILLMPGYLSALDNRPGALKLLKQLAAVGRRDSVALAATELAASAYLELGFNDDPARDLLANRLVTLLTDPNLTATNQLRGLAGLALGRLGDPREEVKAPVPVTVKIPAGPFIMGSERRKGQPGFDDLAFERESTKSGERFRLNLEEYRIGKYPVTVAQFRRFVEEGHGYERKQYWTPEGWARREQEGWTAPHYWDDPVWHVDNHPVVGVSWYEAVAYCRWLTATNPAGHFFRLPDEAMWEKAARGSDGRRWPWGNEWDPTKLNAEQTIGRTSAVGIFPAGRRLADKEGPEEAFIYDCAGNVWEWCSGGDFSDTPYPFETRSYQEDLLVDLIFRAWRGGALNNDIQYTRGTYRHKNNPALRNPNIGFRVVELLSDPDS